MRFGSFVFSISGDPEKDHQVIEATMGEIVLAEQVGLDAVWLTEHHFDGAVAYADPWYSARRWRCAPTGSASGSQ